MAYVSRTNTNVTGIKRTHKQNKLRGIIAMTECTLYSKMAASVNFFYSKVKIHCYWAILLL